MRSNYWNLSKFGTWVLGVERPYALTLQDWDLWREQMRKERPVRYWLSDTMLPYLQEIWSSPKDGWRKIRDYISARWVYRYHLINTRLKAGEYHEVDNRMMHGCFELLVDYVEVQCAWMHELSKRERLRRKPRFRRFRSPQDGIAHLRWAKNLKEDFPGGSSSQPSPQAINAAKAYELYIWWKYIRPERPELWTDDRFSSSAASTYENMCIEEDTQKLIELVKIKNSLWT